MIAGLIGWLIGWLIGLIDWFLAGGFFAAVGGTDWNDGYGCGTCALLRNTYNSN